VCTWRFYGCKTKLALLCHDQSITLWVLQSPGGGSRAASRSNGAVLRTSVSIPYRQGLDQGRAESPFSRPSSASLSRVSLSSAGLRADLGSAPRPPTFPVSASPQPRTAAQTHSVVASSRQRIAVNMQGFDDMQRNGHSASVQNAQTGSVQRAAAHGGQQRPHSAKATTQQSYIVKRKVQRPQSAMGRTVQPPFWTGSLGQDASSQQATIGSLSDDESNMQQSQPDQGSMQQPGPREDILQRPQSAGRSRSSSSFEASRLSQTQLGTSPESPSSSHYSTLRTVPEDEATCLQAGPVRQGASGEGRAGSLRAQRGMYSQPCTSDASTEAASPSQAKQGSSRPGSAQRQHGEHRQSARSRADGQQPANGQGQLSNQENAVDCMAGMRSGTPPKPRGRSTLSAWEGQQHNSTLDLTDQERYSSFASSACLALASVGSSLAVRAQHTTSSGDARQHTHMRYSILVWAIDDAPFCKRTATRDDKQAADEAQPCLHQPQFP